jgi:hypothetical protein
MVDFVLVTEQSHPNLFKAFETISHDSGGGAGHDNYSVHPAWAPYLTEAETALAGLSGGRDGDDLDGDFSTFCIGDVVDMSRIAARSRELTRTLVLLNSFFEDWDKGPNGEELP